MSLCLCGSNSLGRAPGLTLKAARDYIRARMSASVATSPVDLDRAPAIPFDRRRLRTISLVFGLVLIVAANFVLRQTLEHTRLPAYPIFPDDKVPWSWRLLLPIHQELFFTQSPRRRAVFFHDAHRDGGVVCARARNFISL